MNLWLREAFLRLSTAFCACCELTQPEETSSCTLEPSGCALRSSSELTARISSNKLLWSLFLCNTSICIPILVDVRSLPGTCREECLSINYLGMRVSKSLSHREREMINCSAKNRIKWLQLEIWIPWAHHDQRHTDEAKNNFITTSQGCLMMEHLS